jgi:hypothetical protein
MGTSKQDCQKNIVLGKKDAGIENKQYGQTVLKMAE